jgi:1,2-diacylglycerol 3-alpha-glucosyltransferase/glucuronosyltransferase
MKWQLLAHAIRNCGGRSLTAESGIMKVLIATDAWRPQVNGVVRTLGALARATAKIGVEIEFLSPDGFWTFPVPTYPGLRLALPRLKAIAARIEKARADAIHVATEGPIGHAVRNYCMTAGRPFTTSYTTRFPEYIAARSPIPASWIYAALRRFHAAAAITMVATPSLMNELSGRGFANLGMWTRGVDVDLFSPDRAIDLDFPRPIFMTVGRVAVEKNLPAFLSLDLPGTKVIIGAGPQEAELKRRFPAAKFLGQLDNGILAAHLAAADVFVFPSLTDTFGIVQLEALASGVPVAAFPVTGPRDVIGKHPVGVLDDDLRVACMQALWISRETCREFALRYSWENSAREFVAHARKAAFAGTENRAVPLQTTADSEPQSLVPDSDSSTTRMTHEHSL